jgi:negative regulator of flagellin synthesis FlgM
LVDKKTGENVIFREDNIMAININNLSNSNAQVKQKVEQQVQVKQQNSNTSVNAEQAKRVGQDSVSITPQAKQLSDVQKKASEAPVIDQKKIAQIKKAIASGEYRIDPDKLAANIAGFEFKLP